MVAVAHQLALEVADGDEGLLGHGGHYFAAQDDEFLVARFYAPPRWTAIFTLSPGHVGAQATRPGCSFVQLKRRTWDVQRAPFQVIPACGKSPGGATVGAVDGRAGGGLVMRRPGLQ